MTGRKPTNDRPKLVYLFQSTFVTCQVSLRPTSKAPDRGLRCFWSPTTTRTDHFTTICVRTSSVSLRCWNWHTRRPMDWLTCTQKYMEHKVR